MCDSFIAIQNNVLQCGVNDACMITEPSTVSHTTCEIRIMYTLNKHMYSILHYTANYYRLPSMRLAQLNTFIIIMHIGEIRVEEKRKQKMCQEPS